MVRDIEERQDSDQRDEVVSESDEDGDRQIMGLVFFLSSFLMCMKQEDKQFSRFTWSAGWWWGLDKL